MTLGRRRLAACGRSLPDLLAHFRRRRNQVLAGRVGRQVGWTLQRHYFAEDHPIVRTKVGAKFKSGG